jgi:hypothetical protein
MSTWTITDATDGKELGTIKNKVKLIGSKIVAKGAFGHFTIKGNFGNHSFRILRDNVKVKIYFIFDYFIYIKFILIGCED